jgi:DNA invertase Pin-like site-specific DNA recombinase
MQIRVAIYARVSTTDKGQDTENQLRELRELVVNRKRDGWVAGEEYVDYASAKTGDRAEFQRMFADAGNRKFDLLLFWALDRVTREGALKTLQYLERLTDAGVEWWSYKEEYLRSVGPFRDAVLSILATIAKQERLRLSERTKAGMARVKAAGKQLGRPQAIYRRDIAQELRAAGMSWRKMAVELGVGQSTLRADFKRASKRALKAPPKRRGKKPI